MPKQKTGPTFTQSCVIALAVPALIVALGRSCQNSSPISDQAEVVESQPEAMSDEELARQPPEGVRPEHVGRPTYTDLSTGDYLVLLEPIGPVGQLTAEIAYSGSDEVTSLGSNCFDIRQKLSRADLQVGEFVGVYATFADYSQWILRGARYFCE